MARRHSRRGPGDQERVDAFVARGARVERHLPYRDDRYPGRKPGDGSLVDPGVPAARVSGFASAIQAVVWLRPRWLEPRAGRGAQAPDLAVPPPPYQVAGAHRASGEDRGSEKLSDDGRAAEDVP